MEEKSFLFDLDSGNSTPFWEKAFGRAGKQGFKISSDTSLLVVPTVKVDPESGSLEVECKGFQDRPPHESFNYMRTPFLPWGWPVAQDPDRSRSAFVLSQDHACWNTRLEILRKSETGLQYVQKETFEGRPAYLPARKPSHFQINKAVFYSKMKTLMDEYPFGPYNLHSSSCLQLFQFQSEPEQKYLIHSDFTSTAKINKFVENVDDKKNLFNSSLVRTNEIVIGDKNLGKNSRVFGIAKSDKHDVIALKYWEGATVAKLFQSEQELVGAEVISKRELPGKFCCDISFADWLDSFLTLDSSGSLTLTNWASNKMVNEWNKAFSAQVEGFDWAVLEPTTSSPYLFRVGARQSLNLFDIRSGESKLNLAQWDNGECLGNMTSSHNSPFQFYCCTNRMTYLLDERFPGKSMCEWTHPTSREERDIPAGCEAIMTAVDGLEYVTTFWSDGEAVLLVNDWRHTHCSDRDVAMQNGAKLSCQTHAKNMAQHEHILYPVYRGLPVALPSIQYLLNQCSNLSEKSSNRLQVPWTGLKMLTGFKKLFIISVNAVGDLFALQMDHVKMNFALSERAQNVDLHQHYVPEDDLEDLDEFGAPVSTRKKPEDLLTMSEFFSPFWLLDPPNFSYKDSKKKISKDWTDKWEKEFLNVTQHRCSKISIATFVQKRAKLPKHVEDKATIPVVQAKAQGMPKVEPVRRGRKPRPKPVLPCDPSPIPSLPRLLSINEDVSGYTARKVLSIFNDEDNVFEEIEASDEEGRNFIKPPSKVLRQTRAKEAEHQLPVRPIADLAESMVDFQIGIQQDDGYSLMVSTQQPVLGSQDLETERPETTFPWFESQDSLFFSQTQSQSQNADRNQRKKKKYRAGF